jgi:hypothetical protein
VDHEDAGGPVAQSHPAPRRGIRQHSAARERETLRRWQALAEVAARDLALAKLFEGHTDALAIMAELGAPDSDPARAWATWAAEPPTARLELRRTPNGVRLTGRKAWCSGAEIVSHALVTAWDDAGRQCLAAVAIGQPGVTVTTDGWHAAGMGRAASGDVLFDAAPAVEIGEPGQYTARPGFWQGGCGIAACWYGGALPFADAVADLLRRRGAGLAAMSAPAAGYQDPGTPQDRAIAGQGTTAAQWRAWTGWAGLAAATVDELVPPGHRLVVVAPHPDDEVLEAGGLLAATAHAGREQLLVAVTDGKASHPGSLRWPAEKLGPQRRRESAAALRALGAEACAVVRLGLDDGDIAAATARLGDALTVVLRPGDLVVSPWRFDGHPDHEAVGQIVAMLARAG